MVLDSVSVHLTWSERGPQSLSKPQDLLSNLSAVPLGLSLAALLSQLVKRVISEAFVRTHGTLFRGDYVKRQSALEPHLASLASSLSNIAARSVHLKERTRVAAQKLATICQEGRVNDEPSETPSLSNTLYSALIKADQRKFVPAKIPVNGKDDYC
ncbi:hypothetical protein IE53DRAFT_387407 [Violaceomyces palustris]|uniref:Uncharacterized protein n=1 Tax=Violaceomyces palustris TaxID=1673888 RepID=A0ACD0NWW2_9BASI|nr:hypothetical protein IE53DRAFT_387407 [Violaceomyces palustris]